MKEEIGIWITGKENVRAYEQYKRRVKKDEGSLYGKISTRIAEALRRDIQNDAVPDIPANGSDKEDIERFTKAHIFPRFYTVLLRTKKILKGMEKEEFDIDTFRVLVRGILVSDNILPLPENIDRTIDRMKELGWVYIQKDKAIISV